MKRFRNLSIQKKISGLFLGCFLVLLFCIILVLHDVYKEQMYEELIQRGHYEDELILHQMERMEQNMESCCNNMIINLNLSIGSKEGLLGSPAKYNNTIREKILGVMENNFLLYPDVSQILIAYENGDVYLKERNRNFLFSQGEQNLILEFRESGVDTRGMWYFYPGAEPAVYFLKVFRDIAGNVPVGYIMLRMDEKVIYQTYQNEKTENPSEIYIFDENQGLISSTQRDVVQEIYTAGSLEKRQELSKETEQELRKRAGKRDQYVKWYRTSKAWEIVTVLDIKAGMQGVRVITGNIVGVSMILMALFFLFTFRILKKIMHPVIALADHMRRTGAHQIQKIEERPVQDEVGILISSFNQMVETNGKLIQRVAQDEKEKRQLELALLQMQIKPHFLYNTLDTAFCLNRMKQYQEAGRVIKELAGYYRLVLNHGAEWIGFSEELDAVEKYLSIQSIRYGELLSYAISVDEELYEFQIPKMTLQPLVENAIYHGIKPKGEKGHILIVGELRNDEVTISIIDDGIGMTQQMFEEILSGKRESMDQESFGMKSVLERLRLFYGKGTRMELNPVPIGTSIELTIDLKKEDQREI